MKSIFLFFPLLVARKAILFVIISVSFGIAGINLWPAIVYAAGPTPVSGEIATSTIWSAVKSPYVVSGIVTVDVGATLTIGPGVIVKFTPNAALTINGALIATSTTNNPIYFTSLVDDKAGGDTNGDGSASLPSLKDPWNITFINASSSVITNAILRYGNGGIFALNSSLVLASTSFTQMNGQVAIDGSTLDARNISFSGMNRGALSIYGSSTVRVSGVNIQNSVTDGVAVYQSSVLNVDHLTVTAESKGAGLTAFNTSTVYCDQCSFSHIANDNGPSVAVYSGSTLSLTNSDIKNATGTASVALQVYDPAWNSASLIRHSEAFISNTIFQGGTDGIMAFGPVALTLAGDTVTGFSDDGIQAYVGPTVTIQTTAITKNLNSGIEIWGNVAGSIFDSSISGNGRYGIQSRTTLPFAAANNWWGSANGPYHSALNSEGTGNAVSDNVSFSPWLLSKSIRIVQKPIILTPDTEPAKAPCCSSVLFIPGLEASRLYATSSTLLGALAGRPQENQLWEPGLLTSMGQLFLDKSGNSMNSIYTKDIIKTTDEIAMNQGIYQHFSDMLDNLTASGTIAAWRSYPYDWRLDPQSLVDEGTRLANTISKLEPIVVALAGTSKTGKVMLIAHSNGGFLAKLLLSKLQADGKDSLVDTAALVAVPQWGTPLAIPALLSGYGQSLGFGNSILNENTAQELAQNMPSAYTLLPSAAYFSNMGPAVLFDASLDLISNLHKMYGSAITTVTALANFLVGSADHRIAKQPLLALANPSLIANALATHGTLDAWQAPAGVNLVQIAGVGINTLLASRYYARQRTPFEVPSLDMEPQFTSLGDNTVIAGSATAGRAATDYYVDLPTYNTAVGENYGHADILETQPVEKLLADIIQKSSLTPSSLPEFISTSIPAAYKNKPLLMEEISVHSPVTLDMYDGQGRHTGLVTTGQASSSAITFVQNQIPNSYYMPFGEGQYAGVPIQTTGSAVLSGTGVGTFTLDIAVGGRKTEFSDVPILPVSTASFSLASSAPSLNVDYDGDGTADDVLLPSASSSIVHRVSLKRFLGAFGLPDPAEAARGVRVEDLLAKIKFRKPFSKSFSESDRQECVAALRATWGELTKAETH